MYQVSEKFIKAITNNARQIKCYFIYQGKEYYPQNLTIDDNIYNTDIDTFIGTFIAKSGILTLDVKTKLNLENQQINIFMGVLCHDTYEYVPMGSYYIYEKSSNYEYKIIDSKLLFNIPFESKKITYPCSLLDLLKNTCQQSGIELSTFDFPNKDLVIPNEVFYGYDATCSDVIVAIAQASCTFAVINRDNKLELKWFKKQNFEVLMGNQKEKPIIVDEYGPINSLVLSREPQHDDIYIQDVESIEENGLTEVKFSDNPFLDIDRYTSRNAIWERLHGFSYRPISANTQGFFHLDTGDIVTVADSQNQLYDLYIINHSINYTGGCISKLSAPALTKTEINYKIASSIESKVLKTQLVVDKLKGEIEAEINDIITKIENIETNTVSVSINADSKATLNSKTNHINLKSKVVLDGKDITESLVDLNFKWHRVSGNKESDIEWDNAVANGKEVNIAYNDVDLYANFYCTVTTTYGVFLSNFLAITDETDVSNLKVYINSNQPLYQEFNGTSYSPDWTTSGDLILAPVVLDNFMEVPLQLCDITWKKTSGDLDENEIVENGVLTVSSNKLNTEIKSVTYVVDVKYHYSSLSQTITFSSCKDQEETIVGDVTYYTWVYFADNSNGDGISQTSEGKSYIGVANMQTQKEPPYEQIDGKKIYTNLSAFKWTKMVDFQTIIEQIGEPSDTTVLWLDTSLGQLKKYYQFLKAWAPIDDETSIRDNAENVFVTTEKNNSANFTVLSNSIAATVKSVEKVSGDLGNQMQELSTKQEQTDSSINTTITKISELTNNITGLVTKEEFHTYFKFQEDGLHISKSNESFEMVLNDTELAFFEGGTRVAYISNKRLYIEQVVVVQSLQVGDYLLRYDDSVGFVIQ